MEAQATSHTTTKPNKMWLDKVGLAKKNQVEYSSTEQAQAMSQSITLSPSTIVVSWVLKSLPVLYKCYLAPLYNNTMEHNS